MILVDTNLLLRYATPVDPLYSVVDAAVTALTQQGRSLRCVPQNLYEFWVVATRPVEVNGLGLSPDECVSALSRIRRLFPLLPDHSSLPDEWQHLAAKHQCRGKLAHDARLVAAMRTHGLTELLTFNGSDFRRFPGVTVLDPAAP